MGLVELIERFDRPVHEAEVHPTIYPLEPKTGFVDIIIEDEIESGFVDLEGAITHIKNERSLGSLSVKRAKELRQKARKLLGHIKDEE